jgi:hypothetical protein
MVMNKSEQQAAILNQSNTKYNAISNQITNISKLMNDQNINLLKNIPNMKKLKEVTMDNGCDRIFPAIQESTDFVREDLEFMRRNEEEILDLEQDVLNKFEVVLSKEDEILLSQLEHNQKNENNQNQLMDHLIKIQNDIEAIKNLAITDNENESTRRKRSNSLDEIFPIKVDSEENKRRNGKRRPEETAITKTGNPLSNMKSSKQQEIVTMEVSFSISYHYLTIMDTRSG